MFSWVTEVKHLSEDGLTRNMIDFFPRVEFLAKMWSTQTMKTLQLYREHVTLLTLSTPALITHQPVYTGAFTVSQEIWPTTTLGFI